MNDVKCPECGHEAKRRRRYDGRSRCGDVTCDCRGVHEVDIRTCRVKEGDIVTIDCLEWIDPYWEFDNPTVVLRPVYREFETGHTENAIEDVMLDLVCDGELEIGEDPDKPRRWNPRYLKRRFRDALQGKPSQRGYTATRQTFRIVMTKDGLMFEEASR